MPYWENDDTRLKGNSSDYVMLEDEQADFWDGNTPDRPDTVLDASAYRKKISEKINSYHDFYDKFNMKQFAGLKVLEVGCGSGVDAMLWADSSAEYYGLDQSLTNIHHTMHGLNALGYTGFYANASATEIPFPKEYFDVCYSHGVLHHTRKGQIAINEILRVLKPGGTFIGMVYHKDSMNYWRIVYRWGVLGQELFRGFTEERIVARYCEGGGDCGYAQCLTVRQAKELFHRFHSVQVKPCYAGYYEFPDKSNRDLPSQDDIDRIEYAPARCFFRKAVKWKTQEEFDGNGGWFLFVKANK